MSDFDSALKVRQEAAADLNATTVGAGAAGAPAAGVHTVQGIAGMTPVQVQVVNPDDQNPDGLPLNTTRISDEGTEAAVASGAEATNPLVEITVPAGKQGYVRGFGGAASGLGKFTLKVGADLVSAVAKGTPLFSSLGDLNPQAVLATPIPVAGGDKVFLIAENRDKLAQDLYGFVDVYHAN